MDEESGVTDEGADEQETRRVNCQSETPCSAANGLKDHQIQELTNKIANELRPFTEHQCLRELVVRPLTAYLEDNGLRVDKP